MTVSCPWFRQMTTCFRYSDVRFGFVRYSLAAFLVCTSLADQRIQLRVERGKASEERKQSRKIKVTRSSESVGGSHERYYQFA